MLSKVYCRHAAESLEETLLLDLYCTCQVELRCCDSVCVIGVHKQLGSALLLLFVVCLLLNVPATCECISGMDLLRQVYVLPH